MKDLKKCFEDLNFQDVKTYLNTGNVTFESVENISEIKKNLESELSKRFKYEAFVLIYKHEFLDQIILNYPFTKDPDSHAYVIFVDNNDILKELISLGSDLGDESAKIQQGNGVIYWKVLKGSSTDTQFAKIIAKSKYKSMTTVRNVNTLVKIL